jgi:N utilization substance protein A
MTEAEESARRAEEFKVRSSLFIEALDVDEVIAHLLVAEGFASIEEIAETSVDEMMQIQGFDEDVGAELINRANSWLDEQEKKLKEQSQKLGIAEDLLTMDGLSPAQIIKLGEAGVKSKDDFADLATDELIEILGEGSMTNKNAEDLIMKARASWFAEEEQAAANG